jgi:hypothetical protein
MNLLFVPLDIEITETDFILGEKQNYHLKLWETYNIIGKEDNYQRYRSLLDQLPITDITLFTYKFQKNKIVPHVDFQGKKDEEYNHYIENEPSGYHVVLKGQSDSLEIFNGKEWVTTILPKTPIAYVLNLTSCLHRVKEDINRETLYIRGWLDIEKHNSLIERSLKRYGDLAIYSKE